MKFAPESGQDSSLAVALKSLSWDAMPLRGALKDAAQEMPDLARRKMERVK
jgi:hypothetical protein